MPFLPNRAVRPLIFASIWVAATAGCTSEETKQAGLQQESNLKIVGLLYAQSRASNRGRPPADEAAFRKYVEANASKFTDKLPDELLVSERDQLPYVIIYQGQKPATTSSSMQVVAYEQQGLEGKIYVTNDLGDVQEIEASQLTK